jgi:hypothetical protein
MFGLGLAMTGIMTGMSSCSMAAAPVSACDPV